MSTSYLPSSCSVNTPRLKGRISVCSLKTLLLLSCLSTPACFHPRAGTLGDFSPRSRTVSLSPFTQRSATSRCLTSLLLSFKTKQTLIFSFSEPCLSYALETFPRRRQSREHFYHIIASFKLPILSCELLSRS